MTLDAPKVAHVRAERVRWLWKGRLARGKLSILDGDPNLGKSTVALDLAARLSTASPLPDGTQLDGPINTVLLSAEDGIADTIRPRLEAVGADLERITVFRGITDDDGPRPPVLPGDLDKLESLIDEDLASLVIIDPLMAYLGGAYDSHRDQDVRRALHAVAAVAERWGVAVLIVRHLNKAPGGNPLYRGGGSIGIIGAARAGMVIAPDPGREDRMILASTKCNLTKKPESLAYRLVGDDLHDCARVSWQGTSTLTADNLLNPPRETKVDQAEGWLENLLFEGPVLQSEVRARGEAEGHSWASMRRAKDALGAESIRKGEAGKQGGGAWYWSVTGEMSTLTSDETAGQGLDSAPFKVLKSPDGSENGASLHEQAAFVHAWNASLPSPADE